MDINNWCPPEERGPARHTWLNLCEMVEKCQAKTNLSSTSSASSTCSKEIDYEEVGRVKDGLLSVLSTSINDLDCACSASNAAHLLNRNRARTLSVDASLSSLCHRHGGTPWRLRGQSYSASMIGLHEEIIDFYEWINPTKIECQIRAQVFSRLKRAVLERWPNVHVDYFGSFRTGLFLPTSDIDVVVVGNWKSAPHWTLAEIVKNAGIADDLGIKVLDRATVPIVKLMDRDTEIRVDVSFNKRYGIEAAHLINHYLAEYPCLKYLVFTLKQFLLQRDLNTVFTGGVSSYSLILMAISFLQLHPNYNLSNMSIRRMNLGVMLMEFLELYGREYNYLKSAIRIRDGGSYVPKEQIQEQMQEGHRVSMLCIEDPLQPSNDIGRASHGAIRVKRAFEWALYTLQPILFPKQQSAMFAERGSVLARIIRVTDEMVDYRNWLRGSVIASSGQHSAQQPQPLCFEQFEKLSDSRSADENETPLHIYNKMQARGDVEKAEKKVHQRQKHRHYWKNDGEARRQVRYAPRVIYPSNKRKCVDVYIEKNRNHIEKIDKNDCD